MSNQRRYSWKGFFVLALVGFVGLTFEPVAASDWKEVKLSASFTGSYKAKGVGQASYSFGLKQVVPQGGDLHFQVDFTDARETGFFLVGVQSRELGPSFPEKVRGSSGRLVGYDNLRAKAGCFYLLDADTFFVILQPTELTAGNRKVVRPEERGFLHYKKAEESADCSISFRYIMSSTLDGLNELLLLEKNRTPMLAKAEDGVDPENPAAQTAVEAPISDKGRAPSRPSPNLSGEEASLAALYERFQRDSKAFIDSAPPKATVNGCDALLNHSTELDTRIEAVLIVLGAEVKSLEVKAKTIDDRLQISTNLQIKDRMQTLTTDLKKQKEAKEQEQREWAARRKELLDAKKNLYDYRGVLEIMESK